MIKIKQTDDRLKKEAEHSKDKMRYHKWGCFLLTLVSATFWKSNETEKEDDTFIDNIMLLEDICYKSGAIDKELYIKDYGTVCFAISNVFGLEKRLKYVHERKKYSGFPCNHVVIGKWRHKYSHFVLMDGVGNKKNNIVYNSLNDSKMIQHGVMFESRVFKLE